MAYRTATLYIRITKNRRSSFCKPVYQSKGRLKPQYAMVNSANPDPFLVCHTDNGASKSLKLAARMKSCAQCSLRTAHNRVTSLGCFLKDHGVDSIGKGKWAIPPFDEKVPEVYEDDEVALLLGGCDARHRAAFSVMLKALFREKEVVYLTWADVHAKRSVPRVRSKPQYNWRVKKYHERDVTVPRALIDQIMALPKTGPLVFPREDGQPDLHLWRYLKDAAKRTRFAPERAWLHKCRATGCDRAPSAPHAVA